ncbi:MAG: hypothetical protein VW709_07535 [Rickettsiales bacterium]
MSEFADLPEDQATGRIAEIYGEIRQYGAVPYVSSLQRQLATVPGCLEWLWEAARPAFLDGRVPEAAWAAVAGLDLPHLAPIPKPALRTLGVDARSEAQLHGIFETFLRASPVNMVTASLLGHLLDSPSSTSPPTPQVAARWTPPAPPPPLPGFPTDEELGPDARELLSLFRVDMHGARFVPGLYRLLAHWPAYLAHVAVDLIPLFEREDIKRTCYDVVARIDQIVPALVSGISAPPPPFDAATRDALRGSLAVYRGTTSPQMIVFSTMLRDALPSE